MDETTRTNPTQQPSLDANVASWPRLDGSIAFNHLVDYHSYNTYGAYSLSAEEWDNREMIYNFKNNSELTDPISHQQALEKAIGLFIPMLKTTFGEQLHQLTLVCIPASTAEKTKARFEDFARIVTEETGMENGYHHVQVAVDAESKHLADQPLYTIDEEWFKGRDVLLFDDIMATGGSIKSFAGQMTAAGAHVVAAVVLGKTISDKFAREKQDI
ncbi:MAG: phosphoribosyltransferase [Prevotella sp.]|nr:phosphoribosyltransferase [Prevotella sp.]